MTRRNLLPSSRRAFPCLPRPCPATLRPSGGRMSPTARAARLSPASRVAAGDDSDPRLSRLKQALAQRPSQSPVSQAPLRLPVRSVDSTRWRGGRGGAQEWRGLAGAFFFFFFFFRAAIGIGLVAVAVKYGRGVLVFNHRRRILLAFLGSLHSGGKPRPFSDPDVVQLSRLRDREDALRHAAAETFVNDAEVERHGNGQSFIRTRVVKFSVHHDGNGR